jgi:hypothetical protein
LKWDKVEKIYIPIIEEKKYRGKINEASVICRKLIASDSYLLKMVLAHLGSYKNLKIP